MKKQLLILFTAFYVGCNVFSQVKEELKFGDFILFSDIVQLGDGFLFKLEPSVRTTTLFDYRTPNLESKWKLKLPEYSPYRTDVIPSNDNQLVYYRQIFSSKPNSGNRKFVFNQISKDGSVKTITTGNSELWAGATKSMFCTDNYFFMLGVKKENKQDVYLLHRFDHKTFTQKDIVLNLPVSEDYVEYTFASYNGDNFYLVGKSSKKGDYSTLLLMVDENGEVKNKLLISPEFDGKTVFTRTTDPNFGALPFGIRFSNKYKEKAYVDIVDNASFIGDFNQCNSDHPTTTYSVRGDVMVDVPSNAVYFYGCTEDKNLYVQKFDLQGKFQWKIVEQLKEIAGLLYLNVNADNSVNIHTTEMKLGFDSNGKPLYKRMYKLPDSGEYWKLQKENDEVVGLKTFLESKETKKIVSFFIWDNNDELILIGRESNMSGLAPKKASIYRFKIVKK